ncbi:MAG: nucleotidyl transferase AbiEii/AbiGii toxin family protein [Acidimicrobiaceae bacterium]|nr:nucleotidyl transferase AbiEii/AbiGii toxin family protein [Acidimicrobiaceae bacterium]
MAGHPDEFTQLLSTAAASLRLEPDSILQDYWLTACLHNLSESGSPHGMQVFREFKGQREPSAICLFTGGTSLVSAWDITERYSEDLDLLAVDLTGGVAKETLRKARSQISGWVKEPLGQTELAVRQDDDRKKAYRKMWLPVGREEAFLKVEIASEEIASDLLEARPIMSLMGRFATEAQLAKYEELGGFELLCTKPAYTAANKLDALHRRAAKGHFRGLTARVRDLYDLAMIAQSEHADGTRSRIPDLAETAAHSFGRGDESVPRPAKGYADSILFRQGSEAQEHLEQAYPSLANFVWGNLPPFGEALELAASLDNHPF